MAIGTLDFLLKLPNKYPNKFYFMTDKGKGLAYYEDSHKNIFSSGRGFEVLVKTGELQKEGYVVMNNIPVMDDSKAVFEHRFKHGTNEVEHMPGFQAFRLLRPLKGNTYVALTQWQSVSDYEYWRDTPTFQKAHEKYKVKKSAYYAERPFTTTYHMYVEEE